MLPCEKETITFQTHNAPLEYEKRGGTFVIIALENLDGFWYLLRIWKQEWMPFACIQQRVYETRVHDIDELW